LKEIFYGNNYVKFKKVLNDFINDNDFIIKNIDINLYDYNTYNIYYDYNIYLKVYYSNVKKGFISYNKNDVINFPNSSTNLSLNEFSNITLNSDNNYLIKKNNESNYFINKLFINQNALFYYSNYYMQLNFLNTNVNIVDFTALFIQEFKSYNGEN
jgi:hypothetical protein